jgi:hypothetical protein
MKKIFTLLASSFFIRLVLNAQEPAPVAPPQAFSYKATIVKPGGSIVANKTVGLKISILKGSADNPVAGYTEIFTPTTNEYGQIDIIMNIHSIQAKTHLTFVFNYCNLANYTV